MLLRITSTVDAAQSKPDNEKSALIEENEKGFWVFVYAVVILEIIFKKE